MKIAVYGSAAKNVAGKINELARETGRQIASRGYTLITGGCPGIPYSAVLGANEENGKVIGFSPGINEKDHIERFGFPVKGFSRFVYVPEDYPLKDVKGACLKYRNISSVVECDAAVTISGRSGTTNEFTIAYDLGKNIGVLIETGGMSKFFKRLIDDWNKPTGATVIFERYPDKLIETLEKITKEEFERAHHLE